MPEKSYTKELKEAVAALLKSHFPALGTDEPIGGADTVDALVNLYATLVAGAGVPPEYRNFTDPLQHEVDAFLADGGSASELLRLVADAVAYAGPQTRPDDCDHGGEYDEAAEGLEALSASMRIVYG